MHSEGYVQYTNGTNPEYHYTIQDHLGNTRLVYCDKNQNGKIENTNEIIQENHYYPFGMAMKGVWMGDENNYKYKYNGIEQNDNFGIDLSFAHYRTLDPTIGRWLQVDPKAESNIGLSPYNSMNNNPISFTDPNGDSPILIGMAIGALANTATQLISNGGFNNWDWGAFAGSVVAGGVGGGVSSALTSAGIGGFAGGAITGGASGFSQNLTSGLINGNLTGGGLAKSTLLGAGIGGLGQGIGASIDGRRFWDGATVEYAPVSVDGGLTHTQQVGDYNCTCATAEMAVNAQGGSTNQASVRASMGGDPNIDPLLDTEVINSINLYDGLNVDGVQPGLMRGYNSTSDFVSASLARGKSTILTVPGNATAAHSVSVKGSYIKQIHKLNGAFKSKGTFFQIYNPATPKPYFMSSSTLNQNTFTAFSISNW